MMFISAILFVTLHAVSAIREHLDVIDRMGGCGRAHEFPAELAAAAQRWVPPEGRGIDKRVSISSHGLTTGYEASNSEVAWMDGALKRGKICATMMRHEQTASVDSWVSYSASVWAPRGNAARAPTSEESKALSWFTVDGVRVPIEPLHGQGRHPAANIGCGRVPGHDWTRFTRLMYDITYIIMHNACGAATAQTGRVVLFDMGASRGFHGVPGGVNLAKAPTEGGGLDASLPIFHKLLTDRCLEPDKIYAWEISTGLTDEQWWGELPEEKRRKVEFFKRGVNEGSLGDARASKYRDAERGESFLQILEKETSAEDFVVVKLDIDTPAAEHVIINILAERPELAAKVDEFFFEYHYYFDGMGFGWHTCGGDVDTAMGLMHRLRILGIRAHFWI